MELSKNPKTRAIQVELIKRELSRRHLERFTFKIHPEYQNNWHIAKLCNALERIENGSLRRLMVFMPPRHMKSELSSIHFPAWYLGRNPQKEVVVASYAAELSIEFGRKTRDLIDCDDFKNIFPTRLSQSSQSAQRWNTTSGGGYFAVGVGGSLTGRGANLLIIDDPVKNRDEAESKQVRDKTYDWYLSTAYTRLTPDGAVILVMTRWHDDDLAGKLLEKQQESEEKWEVISLPAIAENDEVERKKGDALWPERYPVSRLSEIKKTVGVYEWSSLYQQEPLDSGAQEFKKSMFQYKKMSSVLAENTRRYLTVDPAVSQKDAADPTGFSLNFVDEQNFWHIKAWKKKISPMELIETLFYLHQKFQLEAIGIERGVYSLAIKPFLDAEQRRRGRFLPIKELHHKAQSKETRIRSLLPRYEANAIFHIENECDDLEDELLRFPKAVHDDVMDAVAYQSQVAESGGSAQILGVSDQSNVFPGQFRMNTDYFDYPDVEYDGYDF